MKIIKKLLVLSLAVSLVMSGIVFTKEAKADEVSEWKTNAVTVPAEGQLVPAGYIPVEFNNSMDGYSYEVLMDGNSFYWRDGNIVKTDIGETRQTGDSVKTFTSSDSPKTEVYSTKVQKHTITVKATKDGTTITSEPRTIYVSKKGLAMGDSMGDKVRLEKLNCSWYYNWGLEGFNNAIDGSVPHMPMIWGCELENAAQLLTFSTNSNYVLGCNEPDISSQADKHFYEAIDFWNANISSMNLRKVAPAPADPTGNSSWLKSFMNGDYKCQDDEGNWAPYSWYSGEPFAEATKEFVPGKADEVDSVVLHYYTNRVNEEGLYNAINRLWETYHKPIWITEIGLFGVKGTVSDMSYEQVEKRHMIEEYVKSLVEKLDNIPYVERYCWFPYDIDSTNNVDEFDGSGGTAMFEYDTGLYTDLGCIYSANGNPAGYDAYVILSDEKYEKETTTAAPETTTEKVNPTPAKPGKVALGKPKNVKKKSVSLTWKTVTGAKKYNVNYAMNKKFTKKSKTKTTTKITYKITKLKKKKTYFFRVRAVNDAGKGAWSNVKKIKVRK